MTYMSKNVCILEKHNSYAKWNSQLFAFASAQIEMVPQNYQKLDTEEQISNMEKLIDAMEDDDDVQNVWHNWEE